VQLGVELQRPRWSGLPGLWTVRSWTVAGSFFAVIAGGLGGFDLNGKLIALAPRSGLKPRSSEAFSRDDSAESHALGEGGDLGLHSGQVG
jgi:hypothetical protein